MGEGIKHDSEKPYMMLLDPTAMREVVRSRHMSQPVLLEELQDLLLNPRTTVFATALHFYQMNAVGRKSWPIDALIQTVRVLEHGAKKYDRGNWLLGLATNSAFDGKLISSVERACAAALRHLYAYLAGEVKDSESGLDHLAHMCCECMFAEHYLIVGDPK